MFQTRTSGNFLFLQDQYLAYISYRNKWKFLWYFHCKERLTSDM